MQIASLLSLLQTCIFTEFSEIPTQRKRAQTYWDFLITGVINPCTFFLLQSLQSRKRWMVGETHKQPSLSVCWCRESHQKHVEAEGPTEADARVLPPTWRRLQQQSEAETGVCQWTRHEWSLSTWNPSELILSKLQKGEKAEYSGGLRHSRARPLT